MDTTSGATGSLVDADATEVGGRLPVEVPRLETLGTRLLNCCSTATASRVSFGSRPPGFSVAAYVNPKPKP